jgi:hypothetical protein
MDWSPHSRIWQFHVDLIHVRRRVFCVCSRFPFVSKAREGPDNLAMIRTPKSPLNKFTGLGVAVFLLTFIAGEALTAILAFGTALHLQFRSPCHHSQ